MDEPKIQLTIEEYELFNKILKMTNEPMIVSINEPMIVSINESMNSINESMNSINEPINNEPINNEPMNNEPMNSILETTEPMIVSTTEPMIVSTTEPTTEPMNSILNDSIDKKEKMKDYLKKWREKNNNKIKEYNTNYMKLYYEKNKQKIVEVNKTNRLKNVMTCECGATFQSYSKATHYKTQKHISLMRLMDLLKQK
jgi:dsDNA-binding SOS-regulon protein